MVSDPERRLQSCVNEINEILEEAKIPKYWYSVDHPVDDKINITVENDGIHVFMRDRGKRDEESIRDTPYEALEIVANNLEAKYEYQLKKVIDAKFEKTAKSSYSLTTKLTRIKKDILKPEKDISIKKDKEDIPISKVAALQGKTKKAKKPFCIKNHIVRSDLMPSFQGLSLMHKMPAFRQVSRVHTGIGKSDTSFEITTGTVRSEKLGIIMKSKIKVDTINKGKTTDALAKEKEITEKESDKQEIIIDRIDNSDAET